MHLLSAVIVVSSAAFLCHSASISSLTGASDQKSTQVTPQHSFSKGQNEDSLENDEFKDFEDEEDEEEGEIDENNLPEVKVESLTHLHRKNGEILVPCFGMWWPVGNRPLPPPVYYDYGVDEYYDEEGRRRRRAKKRRAKKAKMRKRKKA